jgi:hypothetical protein
MRYRFIDEVVTLDLGDRPRIEVLKTFAAGDDAFSGPLGPDRVPSSLVLELQAMTGGHLLFERLACRCLPILVKVGECRFERRGRAGVPLRATAELRGLSESRGGPTMAETWTEVFAGEEQLSCARLLFACAPLDGIDGARGVFA